jgi:hypothetical protein
MGVNNGGKITAVQAMLAYEVVHIQAPVGGGMGMLHRTESRMRSWTVMTFWSTSCAALIAPGGSNAAFACETVIDELCEKLVWIPSSSVC